MRASVRRHATTIIVAFVTAAITAGGPALAAAVAEALNADTVDHKHAVGAGASIANRAGKLVATNATGRLPNNIIAKAPDANLLDGKNSTAFLPASGKAANADKLDGRDSSQFAGTVLRPGQLLEGIYAAWGGGVDGYFSDTVQFSPLLPGDLADTHTQFIPGSGPFTDECTAIGQADAGYLCVYEHPAGSGSRDFGSIFTPVTGVGGADRSGFSIYFQATAASAWSYGTWAVRAPAASPALSPQRAPAQARTAP